MTFNLKQFQEERARDFDEKFGVPCILEEDGKPSYAPQIKAREAQTISLLVERIRAEFDQSHKDERQFILNILNGVDMADIGNNGGGTKAVRLALMARTLPVLSPNQDHG
jgi:hypothetical protein